MPPELMSVLVQFPVVALVVGVAVGVIRWRNADHRAELEREKARSDAELARVTADAARAAEDWRDERARLLTRITKLENRLDELRWGDAG